MHSAKYATTTAVWISYLIAAVNGLIAALSFVYQKPFGGISGWSLLDAALFAAAGWGIGRLSRPWAVVGLTFYLLNVLIAMAMRGFGVSDLAPGIVAIIFLMAYVNALRGTFAYHRFVKLPAPRSTDERQMMDPSPR
jgi:hypothetical protein